MFRHAMATLASSLLLVTLATAQAFTLPGYGNELYPDAAYDATNDVFLAVAQDDRALHEDHVVAFRTSPQGPLGGTLHMATVSRRLGPFAWPTHQRVGNINARDTFVVVWQDPYGPSTVLQARGVGAQRRFTNTVTWDAGTSAQVLPDIGGDATTTGDATLVVWHSGSAIQAVRVSVSSAFELNVSAPTVLASESSVSAPAISKSGGAAGRYLVTWRTNGRVKGLVVDRNLTVLASFDVSATGSASAGVRPAVDGDGTSWLLAYDQAGASSDIFGRKVTYHSASTQVTVGSELVLAGEPATNETDPAVAWMGSSYFVGYTANQTVHVKSVDPFTCTTCEGDFPAPDRQQPTPSVARE